MSLNRADIENALTTTGFVCKNPEAKAWRRWELPGVNVWLVVPNKEAVTEIHIGGVTVVVTGVEGFGDNPPTSLVKQRIKCNRPDGADVLREVIRALTAGEYTQLVAGKRGASGGPVQGFSL